ncbi:hypothetical protein BHM03_00022338, partial [Ensete ventricosum]
PQPPIDRSLSIDRKQSTSASSAKAVDLYAIDLSRPLPIRRATARRLLRNTPPLSAACRTTGTSLSLSTMLWLFPTPKDAVPVATFQISGLSLSQRSR